MSTISEERMKILSMIEESKLSAEQAAVLLNALEAQAGKEAMPAPDPTPAVPVEPPAPDTPVKKASWFRVQVTDTNTGKAKVHVRLPLSLLGWGLKMGARYTDELAGIDMDELLEAFRSGQEGKFIEVVDEEDHEHVEIFVE